MEALLDGRTVTAWVARESSEQGPTAPSFSLRSGSDLILAGRVGDSAVVPVDWSSNDVDLYRLELQGNGLQAVNLRLLSKSFGSSLDGALSIFDQAGQLLAVCTSQRHPEPGTFRTEPVLRVGLEPGVYYIGVSSESNLPTVADGFRFTALAAGRSAIGGTGDYVVLVSTETDESSPEWRSSSILPGAVLSSPPSWISLTFSEWVDVTRLWGQAVLTDSAGNSHPMDVVGFDGDTNTVTALVFSRLPAGEYTLRIPSVAVVDAAGRTLADDVLLTFRVASSSPPWGELGVDLVQDTLRHLFVTELTSGVVLRGQIDEAGDREAFPFELPGQQLYGVGLSAPEGTEVYVLDSSGRAVVSLRSNGSLTTGPVWLNAGRYTLWVKGAAETGPYSVQIGTLGGAIPEVPITYDMPVPKVELRISPHLGGPTQTFAEDAAAMSLADETLERVLPWIPRTQDADVPSPGPDHRVAAQSGSGVGGPQEQLTLRPGVPPLLHRSVISGMEEKPSPLLSPEMLYSIDQVGKQLSVWSGTSEQEPLSLVDGFRYALTSWWKGVHGQPSNASEEADQLLEEWIEMERWQLTDASANTDDPGAVAMRGGSPPMDASTHHEPRNHGSSEDGAWSTSEAIVCSAGAACLVGGTAGTTLRGRRLLTWALRRLLQLLGS
jgi:hypothetical protein